MVLEGAQITYDEQTAFSPKQSSRPELIRTTTQTKSTSGTTNLTVNTKQTVNARNTQSNFSKGGLIANGKDKSTVASGGGASTYAEAAKAYIN